MRQARSSDAERWLREDRELVLWTLTPVEVVSALRRLVRDSTLREAAARAAEELVAEIVDRTHVVTDVEGVKASAVRLLRVHALRTPDALQPGAALAWAAGSPRGLSLHTFDRRLALAAEREGFRVLPAE